MFLHMGDLQVLQHHSAVAVGLQHVRIVVVCGAQPVQTIGDALTCCKGMKPTRVMKMLFSLFLTKINPINPDVTKQHTLAYYHVKMYNLGQILMTERC